MKAWLYCRCGVGFDGECDPNGFVLGDDECPACGDRLRATSPAFADQSDDDRYLLTDKGRAAIGAAPVNA